MEDVHSVSSRITLEAETPLTIREQPPYSHPLFLIDLKLSCNAYFSDWVITSYSAEPQFLDEVQHPRIESFIHLSLRQFLWHERAREIIDMELINWPVWGVERRELLDFVLEQTRRAVISTPPGHNLLHMDFRVSVSHKRIYNETVIDQILQQSMEEDTDFMIPAADSSIASLERKKITEPGTSCSICMEEFEEGCDGVCMPCSHVFHGDCINKWLTTSHYCPLCRFEMPVCS
ncbi:E3 ubiquitin-protein ligase RNF43-like [Sesamum indicum]|uniref:RING-type E3 ubiquitin transferase n=1 Tax=Sesamum indicum TaxID=4182 RepID=A0A6I9SMT0_SESIN|nr:E3 ubiquitin-protein ligase RNF43-like [Sesamum indicum]